MEGGNGEGERERDGFARKVRQSEAKRGRERGTVGGKYRNPLVRGASLGKQTLVCVIRCPSPWAYDRFGPLVRNFGVRSRGIRNLIRGEPMTLCCCMNSFGSGPSTVSPRPTHMPRPQRQGATGPGRVSDAVWAKHCWVRCERVAEMANRPFVKFLRLRGLCPPPPDCGLPVGQRRWHMVFIRWREFCVAMAVLHGFRGELERAE